MAVPREFLDELRARADLAAVVGRHVRLERRGREFVGLSPFQKEKTPSFTVVPDKGFYHCFSSGKHGDVFSFLMEVENLTFREAIERLAGEVGLELPRETPEEAARDSRRAGLKEANEAAARLFARQLESPAGAQTRHYLAERGVQPETIRTFRLGLAPSSGQWLAPALEAQGIPVDLALEAGLLVRPDDGRAPFDRFRHRLMFPITDLRGDVIAFGGRALGDAPAKYLNSPETPLFHKGATLYGLAAARQAARDQQAVIVVEGYMDVIAMHQAGFAHAVAPLGTALTEAQLALLWRLSDEPAICFDGDAAGQRAAARVAERALPQLVPGRSLGFVWLPAGEDPDSLLQRDGPAAMSRALAAVTPLADLVWRLEWGARPLETPEQRANLEQRLDARVAVIGDRRVAHWYRERFREYLRGAFPYGAHRAGRPQARSTGRFGERPATAGLRQPVALPVGRPDLAVLRHRQIEGLLAAFINQPALRAERRGDLKHLAIDDPKLDKVRLELVNPALSGLDTDGLRAHLTACGWQEELDRILSRSVNELAGFAAPGTPLDEASRRWREELAFASRRKSGVKASGGTHMQVQD